MNDEKVSDVYTIFRKVAETLTMTTKDTVTKTIDRKRSDSYAVVLKHTEDMTI